MSINSAEQVDFHTLSLILLIPCIMVSRTNWTQQHELVPSRNVQTKTFQNTNLMHSSFILQQYICYTTLLSMFRAARCSSSGGPIVSPQPPVSSPSVSSCTVCGWRADCSPLSTHILYGCLQRVTILEAVVIRLALLMMSSVLLETCWGA